MAVFHASVLLLIMNFVKTFSTSCFDNVVMKFIVSNGTDAFMTGRKICALQAAPVVPYKALGNFCKALYGTMGGTCSAQCFRPVMNTDVLICFLQ